MLAIAVGGLVVNLVAARILHGHARDSLNVSAALRHVLADLLGSVGVIVAALIILVTGWEYADPVVSVLIGAPDPGELVGNPARLDPDPARGLAARAPTSRRSDSRWPRCPGSTRSTTCTYGRSPPGSRRSPPTCWSTATPTATRPGAALERMLDERFGLEHTTLQVDHEGGELLQIETGGYGTPAEKLTE